MWPFTDMIRRNTTLPGPITNLGHEVEIEIIHNNTDKLDRLLSIRPLYLAIQDLWVSLARVSSTRYTYRHT
jgi:hypothetical protein